MDEIPTVVVEPMPSTMIKHDDYVVLNRPYAVGVPLWRGKCLKCGGEWERLDRGVESVTFGGMVVGRQRAGV